MRSLSQFQALQDGEKELASLRELGLTDAEIQLWQSRDAPEAAEKVKPAGDREVAQNRRSRVRSRPCMCGVCMFCFFLNPNTSSSDRLETLNLLVGINEVSIFSLSSATLHVWKCKKKKCKNISI